MASMSQAFVTFDNTTAPGVVQSFIEAVNEKPTESDCYPNWLSVHVSCLDETTGDSFPVCWYTGDRRKRTDNGHRKTEDRGLQKTPGFYYTEREK
jgi:hypothetical protein